MSDNHDHRSDAAEAMLKKIEDDRAQKDRDQRLTAAKAKSDAAEAMMKKIEDDRVRKEEEEEEEKKQIEENNRRIEIERKAKVKKEQDAKEEQRRQLIIEEARSISRKFSGSLYKTRTVHLSERSTLTDPSQASSSSKYVASVPGSTISTNVDAKESVGISAIQNQHSSFSTASKNKASEPTVRMSDVFGKLVMMKIKAKQAKIRTKNHRSKKVAHNLGVRLDRRSGVMLSETAARDLIHAVKLLAASPVNQEWLSTSNAHDGILVNNSSTAEALIFTLKDYDYNTNTAQTIVQSIKRVPQELRQGIQKFLNEDELFQLLICFANFDFNKNGVLDFEEFRALFSSLISATGVQHFFVTMDLDNDGTIAFGEFLALIATFVSSSQKGDENETPEIGKMRKKEQILEGLADIGLRNVQSLGSKNFKNSFQVRRCGVTVIIDLLWPLVWLVWLSIHYCSSSVAPRINLLQFIVRQPPHTSFSGSFAIVTCMWSLVIASLFITGRLEWANRDTLYLYLYHSVVLGVLSGYGSLATLDSPDMNPSEVNEYEENENIEQQRRRKSFGGIFRRGSSSSTASAWPSSSPTSPTSSILPVKSKSKSGTSWRTDARVGAVAKRRQDFDRAQSIKASIRRAMKHNNNTNERLHEILVPDEKSESKADISNDDAGDISTKQRLPPHKNKRNKSSALHFTHAEFFAPESIHAHEERFRTNLIFFNVETAGRCDNAREVFEEVLAAGDRANHARSHWMPLFLSCFFSLFRFAICELWSLTWPGPMDSFSTLINHKTLSSAYTNRSVDLFYRSISASRLEHSAVPTGWMYLGWAARSLGSIFIFGHTLYIVLCVREEFVNQIVRVQLLGSLTSPEKSLQDGVPFLNLQVWSNVVAFTNIRTYMVSVYHLEVQRIIQAVQTTVAVVGLTLFFILAFEYTIYVLPVATTPGEFISAREAVYWVDFSVYVGLTVLFIQAGCELTSLTDDLVRILAFERWRVEVKARGSTTDDGETVGIIASRFDRVRDALTQVISFLQLIQEENSILGIEAGTGLRNAVAGFYMAVIGFALQGMYSLHVMGETMEYV